MKADGGDNAFRGLAVAGWGERPHGGVYAGLLLTSAALLMLEVSLTRFFSYTIWYHFAYLTISVALLGFGSSGAIIAAYPRLLARRGQGFLVGCLLLSAVLAAAGLVLLAGHPIEVQNLMNKPLHFSMSLLVYYVVVAAPFLLAGFAVGVPFAAWPARMGVLYFWDLAGAAAGCGLVVPLIGVLGVPGVVFAAAALLVLAAASLLAGEGRRPAAALVAAIAVAGLALAGPSGEALPILLTATKNVNDLRAEGAGGEARTDVFHRWTALNRVDAFGWDHPSPHSFWSRIGMSNSWKGTPPLVARLTYDGSNGSDIFSSRGNIPQEYEMLEHHLLRLPYTILDRPQVLVIGVGGGIDLFNAVKQGARHVTGAELQPVTVNLLQERLRDFTSGFYDRDDVTLVQGEGRHVVRKSRELYDLVQITTVDTFAAQAAGAYVLAESYLYTVEAMRDYLAHLSPDGVVTVVLGDITFEGEFPPLGSRAAMIGLRALEADGVADPASHIVVVGSVTTGALAIDQSILVKKSPFTADELSRIRAFVQENGFHVLWAPDGGAYPLAPLLGVGEEERQAAMRSALFNVEATYDANPFFYNVGKWSNLSARKSTIFINPGSFMGQMVLILMVLQSTLLGALLVLFPLARGAREGLEGPGVVRYLAYFLALGVGFMFVEISFVQSFVLFLGSPTYALSVTIFSLLAFSACGSLASTRLTSRPEAALRVLAPSLALLVGLYSAGLSRVFDAALPLDLGVRIAIAVVAQLPIGLVLGMFMPLGIACIARDHPRLVPWAWGVNGVGSVAGTTLAVLLAMASGFHAVALVAALLYLAGTGLLLGAARSRAA